MTETQTQERYPNVSEILEPNQWQGKPAFVIGGGSSLRGFDFSQLQDDRWRTIGANAAYRHNPDVVVAMDLRFLELVKDRPEWRDSPSIKVVTKSCVREKKDLGGPLYWMATTNDDLDGWSREFVGGLKGTNNTGAFALQIADVLGADPIFLLGFDMYGDGKKTANYHEVYPPSWSANACVYDQYNSSFIPALQHARARVVNCNPKSNLYFFPKCEIRDALEIARGEKSYREVFSESRQIGTTAGVFTIDSKPGISPMQHIEETKPPNVVLGELAEQSSEINEHLVTLRDIGKEIDTVLEFGTGLLARSAVSWIAARVARLETWDIKPLGALVEKRLRDMARMSHTRLLIQKGSTDEVFVDRDHDLLFTNGRHRGKTLASELANNHQHIRRYIIIHDVVTFGWNAKSRIPNVMIRDFQNVKIPTADDGLLPAIFGFLSEHPEWKIRRCYTNNNGLLILERAANSPGP